jgi:hypothetical protein
MLHLHLEKHYCSLKWLNKVQYTAVIPNYTKHKSLISLRQAMLLSRYYVTHCVRKTDACRTRGKVLTTTFRKEIDVSSHIKMTYSMYFMQDHVTSQVWFTRCFSKYLTGYQLLKQLDFLKASTRYIRIFAVPRNAVLEFVYESSVVDITLIKGLFSLSVLQCSSKIHAGL